MSVTVVDVMASAYWVCIGHMLGALLEPLKLEAKVVATLAVVGFCVMEACG